MFEDKVLKEYLERNIKWPRQGYNLYSGKGKRRIDSVLEYHHVNDVSNERLA
jgi:hypothetical protein